MLGEVLEWIALALAVAAIAISFGLAAALGAAAVAMFYEAQCHAAQPLRIPNPFKRKPKEDQ